ncbi:LPS-assembly protein LptD [Tropicimonas isoalkanivorans]|uniref:LPS-assembly protein LptD n=1 Tax=Tropicimonas isoalkanivorans TaxID=441112 RepID=A0A1I1DUN7_9RHOB|nr:LPS assembly protein LptD [Tropicimonas isoalkanivorans]SFB78769.1 LPS-assembly protein [Tropicimonas isoalkanivorans]
MRRPPFRMALARIRHFLRSSVSAFRYDAPGAACSGAGLVAGALVAFCATSAAAQATPPATLVADKVEITADGSLVATGSVEALYEDARLKAERIVYNPDADRLEIDGPIVLTQGDNTIVLADSAALSPDLQDGLLRSARVVMDQQLQLAAAEIDRVDGRYTQLYKTVASSCEVCAARPVPLWQIRARRVVHDDVEKQLYFDHAIFEVAGVPVMYLPRLRLPDPTVERATGFLTPFLRTTDELGFGIKAPYFVTLGQNRDVTFTPYWSSNRTRTLELRYREAFRNGEIEFNGAVSRDDIRPEGPRAYLFGEGAFELPYGFDLDFGLETASDDTYLIDYDYSDVDRLDSFVSLSRTRRDRTFLAETHVYRSLRSTDDRETQPYLVGDASWAHRFDAPWIGGTADYFLAYHGHRRRSDLDIEGRDVSRLAGELGWRRNWIGPAGLLFNASARGVLDHTQVRDDNRYDDEITRFTPFGIAEVRWPWQKQAARASHVIEPVVQVVWSPDTDETLPQDESTQLEFDEGNLFGLSRFPSGDVLERGLRANVGVAWTRYDPSGWNLQTTVGRVYREQDLGQFAGYDSLDGRWSDWLASVELDIPGRLTVVNRTLFNDEFDLTKNETRLGWNSDPLEFSTTYVWLEPSLVEDRDVTTHEFGFAGDWDIDQRWRSTLDMRYDIELNRAASARLGLEYRTECATFDFGVRRRFTSTEQLNPTTDFTFEVQLAGFGTAEGGRPRPSRVGCRG